MGISRVIIGCTNTLVTPTLVADAETVVLVLPPFDGPVDSDRFLIDASADVATDGVATDLVAKLYRGHDATGVLLATYSWIADVTNSLAAAVAKAIDRPGIVAGQQWCLTLTATGASGNSTVGAAVLAVFAL